MREIGIEQNAVMSDEEPDKVKEEMWGLGSSFRCRLAIEDLGEG